MGHPSIPSSDFRRALVWRLRTREIKFGQMPLLMGIVNVTPDSFSDGGESFEPRRAVDHALELIAAGADLIDIGGESTRPYASIVPADEECRRVLPVITTLRVQTNVPISIDTSKASVAAAAIDAGAEVINDVTALAGDPQMAALATRSRVGVCAMHMQGTPQTMQDAPHYNDVVAEIHDWLARRRDSLIDAGISHDQVCLDPGIGFGKSHVHNLTLMSRCGEFHELGCPLLVGHSRKGFLAKVLDDPQGDRDAATAGAAIVAALQGVQILRVHNVRVVRGALQAFEACGGLGVGSVN